MTNYRAWYFCSGRHRDGTPLEVGRADTVEPPPGGWRSPFEFLEKGLHAFQHPFYAVLLRDCPPGDVLCRVRMAGETSELYGSVTATNRVVLAAKEFAPQLRLFACAQVRTAPLADGRTVWDLLTDVRSRRVVEVAEAFARGEVAEEELDSARAAAWDAARNVARRASDSGLTHIWGVAAAAEAARGTAWRSARDAAWASVRDVARAVGWFSRVTAIDPTRWEGDEAERTARAAAESAARDAFKAFVEREFAVALAFAGEENA